MFLAVTKKKEWLSAEEYSSRLKNEPMYCPGCNRRVSLKSGSIVRSHFAHTKNAACHSFSEGETAFHLEGKLQLGEWLAKQGIPYLLEAWLPSLKQRPDLLVQQAIPLEYQCSLIPSSLIHSRTEGYHSISLDPLWIGGSSYAFEGVLLDRHRRLLRYSKERGYHFTVMDTEMKSFLFYEHIHFANANQLRYTFTKKPLVDTSFFELLTPKSSPPFLHPTGHSLTFNKRMNILHMKDTYHQHFLERIYLNRHSLQNLPSFLFHYPTKSIAILEPSYGWKYAFLMLLLEHPEGITNFEINHFARQRKLAELPLCEETDAEAIINCFLKELVDRKWVKKSNQNRWIANFSSTLQIENY